MIDAASLRASGTSPAAIAHHYDLSDDFFALWLGPDLVYSCALWDGHDPSETLATRAAPQDRLLRRRARRRRRAAARHRLRLGCPARSLRRGARPGRRRRAHAQPTRRRTSRDAARCPASTSGVESWVDHEPDPPYDAITCIEATEHLASDGSTPTRRWRSTARSSSGARRGCATGGRLGLQLICLDNVGHEGSRPGRGRVVRADPRATSFPSRCRRRCPSSSWAGRPTSSSSAFSTTPTTTGGRSARGASPTVPPKRARARWWATDGTDLRALLRRRRGVLPAARAVAVPRHPQEALAAEGVGPASSRRPGRGTALDDRDDGAPLAGEDRRRRRFAVGRPRSLRRLQRLLRAVARADDDVLVGALAVGRRRPRGSRRRARAEDRLLRRARPSSARRARPRRRLRLGRQPAPARRRAPRSSGAVGPHAERGAARLPRPPSGARRGLRLESWADHEPQRPYDAILVLRRLRALRPRRDDARRARARVPAVLRALLRVADTRTAASASRRSPTTGHPTPPSPLGRGPLGDSVLDIYPESICPHLCELVLGFEPYFEVEVLRSDAGDFARTCRLWLRGPARARGASRRAGRRRRTVRRFRRYLVASEVQFRTGIITNYRVVLHRRPALRR